MDMTGERRIEASRETVWQALNDPVVLKASIPGCESLEKLSDTDMKAIASVKIGPIAARFNGAVHLSDRDPPHGETIGRRGQGVWPGVPKGGARRALSRAGEVTPPANEVAREGRRQDRRNSRRDWVDVTAKQMGADLRFTTGSAPRSRRASQNQRATGSPSCPQRGGGEPCVADVPTPPSAVSMFALIRPEPMGSATCRMDRRCDLS